MPLLFPLVKKFHRSEPELVDREDIRKFPAKYIFNLLVFLSIVCMGRIFRWLGVAHSRLENEYKSCTTWDNSLWENVALIIVAGI
jgi:hypothetical protein